MCGSSGGLVRGLVRRRHGASVRWRHTDGPVWLVNQSLPGVPERSALIHGHRKSWYLTAAETDLRMKKGAQTRGAITPQLRTWRKHINGGTERRWGLP